MTNHQEPHGNMNAAELLALFADEGRHPNALRYELIHCRKDVLAEIMWGSSTPPELANLALVESVRRTQAVSRLLADNPAIARAMADRAVA